MSLQNLLDMSASHTSDLKKDEISQERLEAVMPDLRKLIAYYREYPDVFVDDIKGDDCPFKFRDTQRIFLRACMRHKYVYATFTRGFSKSFLAIMSLMLKGILFPGAKLFVTTGGKEQAALITMSKVEEICKLIPALGREINFDRGVSKTSKDNLKYVFRNGSVLDILAARESSRGQRRTGGLIEEVILVEEKSLNEIIIPTTNVDRNLPDGTTDPDEVINQSQVYITSAGWKNSFAYDKQIELLIASIFEPDKYFVFGGDYELAILEGAVKKDMVNEMKLSGTYNEASFDREYGSVWSGDQDNAYFSSASFDRHRVLLLSEKEFSGKSSKSAYYILGVDVGRKDCNSEVAVIKVTPQPQGDSIKSLVNLYSFAATHFEEQAIYIKKLYYQFKARRVIIDANGLGVGFVDFMTKAQIDPIDGTELPAFGVEGGTYEGADQDYKQLRIEGAEKNAMFLIKANAPINTEAHSYVQTQLSSGKIKLLIDEQTAKAKLMQTKVGQNMTPDERNEYLMPYQQTSILKEQMLNLVESNDGVNIILKQNNRGIPKDKFSAFEYALYYIKEDENKKKRRRTHNIADMMFFGR